MATFRFRAQPALDLRRREDEDATRAYAQAERDLLAAAALLQEADGRLSGARSAHTQALGVTGDAEQLQWYRFWILRLEQERKTCVARVALCEEKLKAAATARQRTHQRVKSLEKLKGKSADAFEQRALAEEQKDNDMVGTMRFVAARRRN